MLKKDLIWLRIYGYIERCNWCRNVGDTFGREKITLGTIPWVQVVKQIKSDEWKISPRPRS